MDDLNLVGVMWAIVVLLLGWTWVPAAIAAMGGARYSNFKQDDPDDLEPEADERDFTFWHRQIIELAYAPIGTWRMRMTFHGADWLYESRVRGYYSRASRTYAFIHKLDRPVNLWWLTKFATCWTDGGLLVTNNMVARRLEELDYLAQGMETTDMAALEEVHKKEMSLQIAGGKRAEAMGDLSTLLTATATHTGPAAAKLCARIGRKYLVLNALVHMVATLAASFLDGFDAVYVPLINLFLWAFLAMARREQRRRGETEMRAMIARESRVRKRQSRGDLAR